MGKHLLKLYSFRTSDVLIEKVNYIAEQHTRTRNKEIEHVLKQYVKEFESLHGEIKIKE